MKKIKLDEYQTIILNILKYIDDVCRKNDIKYSLIGGSLIGAIREKGIIPWDDDIDIIMNLEDYKKFRDVIGNMDNNIYKLYEINDDDYPFSYSKMIDTRTSIVEPSAIDIKNYGAFVDVFINHHTPNIYMFRKMHYLILRIKQSFITGFLWNDKHYKKEKGLRKIRTLLSKKIGIKKLIKSFYKTITKYDNNKKSDYYIQDLVAFDYDIIVLPSKFYDEYIDVDFSDFKAMAIKEYDSYLRLIFGDYMKRPPENERKTHNIEAYWKE